MKTKLKGMNESLEISLAEYGFAYSIEYQNDKAKEITFYYGIQTTFDPDYNQDYYSGFDCASLACDIDIYKEYDWINPIDWKSILESNGMTKQGFDEEPLFFQVWILFNYYGLDQSHRLEKYIRKQWLENIFGLSYYGAIFTLQELLDSNKEN